MQRYNDSNYGIDRDESKRNTFLGKKVHEVYHKIINQFIKEANIKTTIIDVGCAEGDSLIEMIPHRNNNFIGFDISNVMLNIAQSRIKSSKVKFIKGSVYKTKFDDNSFELVIATEILEHLEYPEKALSELNRIARKFLIISVPNEPIFSLLNLIRFRHINNFGSTPGHLQKFTRRQFKNILLQRFEIIEMKSPLFIWNIALCKIKKG